MNPYDAVRSYVQSYGSSLNNYDSQTWLETWTLSMEVCGAVLRSVQIWTSRNHVTACRLFMFRWKWGLKLFWFRSDRITKIISISSLYIYIFFTFFQLCSGHTFPRRLVETLLFKLYDWMFSVLFHRMSQGSGVFEGQKLIERWDSIELTSDLGFIMQ